MPAQKHSHEAPEDDDPMQDEDNNHEQPEDEEESDRSPSSSNEDKDEYVVIKLSEIRKEVQCPICLGIIRKTRTVMDCLHRFCRECIDKSMRLGNNECPACRTHCASRRSLRDDPNYDALIAALYPDIDKYEEEELAFHEEEKARNKQIQASIAQTLQRQTEALGRKRPAKASATAFVRRSQGTYRNGHLRGRRNSRNASEFQESDNEDANGNDEGKDSSSADELTETKPKRCKRWGGARFSQSSAASGADGGGSENDPEVTGASARLVGSSERLSWGKGGMRSHNRYGSMSGSNGKIARNSRISKLIDHLRNSEKKEDGLDIHLMLFSLDEQTIPSLQRPYLMCKPTISVRHLCQYVALQTACSLHEVELCLVKEPHHSVTFPNSAEDPPTKSRMIDSCRDKLLVLGEKETLVDLKNHNFSHGYLLLVYRKKI